MKDLFKRTTIIFLGILLLAVDVYAQRPAMPKEMQKRDHWLSKHLLGVKSIPAATVKHRSNDLPFSFDYDGKSSNEFLVTWRKEMFMQKLDNLRRQHSIIWTDPSTGLQVTCVAVEYADYPVIEWTIYLKNIGTKDTPILQNILGINSLFERTAKTEYVLHSIKGDSNTPDSFQPITETLAPGINKFFTPVGGRSTNASFPCFNVQMSGEGVILGLGWPGQWMISFNRDAGHGLQINAGQAMTHLYLKPGEQIRTPLVVLFFWQGRDTIRSQNLWRQWMMAHNMPRPGGKAPGPIYSFCSGGFFPNLLVSETSEKQFIDVLRREKIKLDYWWMDAGWYPCEKWPQVGTWEPDPIRFPNGLKAISDYVHGIGTKLIVWFEPERVEKESWLSRNHPEWLLGGKLLNLGNPAAHTWLVEHVDSLLTSQAIDLYRQDFNMDPLLFWRNNDPPDRQGITENLYLQGHLAYWDELRRRHPDMLIDNCASGGRRNDLESLRRSVPLLRSDYQSFEGDPKFAPGNQGQTYGLSSWIPYYGTGVYFSKQDFVYSVRSHMCPAFVIAVDVRKPDIDWSLYRRLVEQWRLVAEDMLGDYYPLTPYSLGEENWIAWQFHRPVQDRGMVQAFRRNKNEASTKTLRLYGLNEAASYEVIDLDTETSRIVTGRELMKKGLTIEIKTMPGAALITYKKAEKKSEKRSENKSVSRPSIALPKHGAIWVVAHRGSHQGVPENTLAAYQKAIDEGADFVEIDVRTTRDGCFVSFHNESIEEPAASGIHHKISDMTLQQLQSIDIGSRIDPKWKNERIPQLADILGLCKAKIGIYLDLKEASVDSLARIIQTWQMTRNVLWYADDAELQRLIAMCPDCIIMPDPGPEKNLESVIRLFHPNFIATTWEHFSASFAERCAQAGIKIIMDDENPECWDQAIRWGCNGIQTDHPKELIGLLKTRTGR